MNKWLIISYYSNIDDSAQANWIDDRLPYLKENDIEVLLLSGLCGNKHAELFHKRVPSIDPAGFKYELSFLLKKKGFNGFLLKLFVILIFLPAYPLYLLETRVLNLWGESQYGWSVTAAIAGYLIAINKKPSAIYTSGGPISAHIAGAIISKLTNIPWVAELQDPIVGRDIGRNNMSKKSLACIENMILSQAKKVIFCTRKAKESSETRHGYGKSVCIYPGAPLEKIPRNDYIKTKKCRFIHTGALYQSRNLDYFFKGLMEAIPERPDLINYFELELYGGIHSHFIKRQVNEFSYNKMVSYHGIVERKDALKYALRSDVLLLIQNTDYRSCETIPSKVYEYLCLGKPILGLVYNNEELRQMLQSHGHLAVSADNQKEIKEAIIKFFDSWRVNKLNDESRLRTSKLTVKNATVQLVDLVAH